MDRYTVTFNNTCIRSRNCTLVRKLTTWARTADRCKYFSKLDLEYILWLNKRHMHKQRLATSPSLVLCSGSVFRYKCTHCLRYVYHLKNERYQVKTYQENLQNTIFSENSSIQSKWKWCFKSRHMTQTRQNRRYLSESWGLPNFVNNICIEHQIQTLLHSISIQDRSEINLNQYQTNI